MVQLCAIMLIRSARSSAVSAYSTVCRCFHIEHCFHGCVLWKKARTQFIHSPEAFCRGHSCKASHVVLLHLTSDRNGSQSRPNLPKSCRRPRVPKSSGSAIFPQNCMQRQSFHFPGFSFNISWQRSSETAF